MASMSFQYGFKMLTFQSSFMLYIMYMAGLSTVLVLAYTSNIASDMHRWCCRACGIVTYSFKTFFMDSFFSTTQKCGAISSLALSANRFVPPLLIHHFIAQDEQICKVLCSINRVMTRVSYYAQDMQFSLIPCSKHLTK